MVTKQTHMDDLWQQFHRLPTTIRDSVARPEALAAVDSIEQRYPSLDLASFIMRVVIKEFPVNDIPRRLVDEFGLRENDANAVNEELGRTVFSGLEDYLGPMAKPRPSVPVQPTIATAPPPPANLPIGSMPTAPVPIPSTAPAALRPITPAPAPIIKTPPAALPSAAPVFTPQKPVGSIAPTQAYSDDDAQEIAQQARRLQAITTPPPTGLDEIAQRVIAQHHLAFHDELLAKRAVAILKARLKNIRNAEETMIMLVRAPKVGGLGLDQDIAKQVVASLEGQAQTVKERGMVREPDVIAPPPPPAMPPLQAQKPIPNPPLYRDSVSATARPALLPTPPLTAPTPTQAPPAIKRPSDIPVPPTIPPVSLPGIPLPTPTPKPAPVLRRERMIDRPAVADITRPLKTIGPAEEMRTMTLTEFRRLGQGANESTMRLLEKFKQLQRESFTLWAEALSGWRQSEVYQLYLDMGRQSLEQAMGISEIIKLRAKANQLYLSEHEFTALADFNRELQS